MAYHLKWLPNGSRFFCSLLTSQFTFIMMIGFLSSIFLSERGQQADCLAKIIKNKYIQFYLSAEFTNTEKKIKMHLKCNL